MARFGSLSAALTPMLDHTATTKGVDQWMVALAADLFPLFRSITGDGLRETLRRLGRDVPLVIHEVPTGTAVLDWTIPKEWVFRGAFIADLQGRRVVDAAVSNLHVVSYSEPVDRVVTRDELELHLHSIDMHPDWIPYRTQFFGTGWGFCVTDRQRRAMTDSTYRVVIDSALVNGSLSYGEVFLPGSSDEELLVFTHACHPSLANDNLSGLVVCTAAARHLAERERRLGYRFVFAPTTIGSIAWLARNRAGLARIRGGIVVSNVGDNGPLTYKRSRRASVMDRAASHVLATIGETTRMLDFSPWGYDERQFCSPGFDLPIGRLTRSIEGEYPEYHTSADTLSLIDGARLTGSLSALVRILGTVERDRRMVNLAPDGEPQLGRRGLFRSGTQPGRPSDEHLAMLWALSFSDGTHSLLDIAARSGIPFGRLDDAAIALESGGLLAEQRRNDVQGMELPR